MASTDNTLEPAKALTNQIYISYCSLTFDVAANVIG